MFTATSLRDRRYQLAAGAAVGLWALDGPRTRWLFKAGLWAPASLAGLALYRDQHGGGGGTLLDMLAAALGASPAAARQLLGDLAGLALARVLLLAALDARRYATALFGRGLPDRGSWRRLTKEVSASLLSMGAEGSYLNMHVSF